MNDMVHHDKPGEVFPAIHTAWSTPVSVSAVAAAADTIAARVDVGARVWRRVTEDPTRSDQRVDGHPGFEVALDLAGSDTCTVDTLVETLGVGVFPTQPDAVVVGEAHQLLPEDAAELALMLVLRRRAKLSRAQCQEYWLHRHGSLAVSIPGLSGYRQLHAREQRPSGVEVGEFDGVASIGFADFSAFAVTMSNPEIASTALEDERRFVDHQRSGLGLFSLVHAVG